jgi:N-acetylglucosaminyldiphosphoundecaprenol N-acetyl-beta-D-mannosaminyltransferase
MCIATAIKTGSKQVIASQNLHGVFFYQRDDRFRRLHQQSVIFIDGMSLVVAGVLAGYTIGGQHRNTPLDWLFELLRTASDKSWRVYYVGNSLVTLEQGLARLKEVFPDLQIGGRDGYFCLDAASAENKRAVDEINAFQPSILLVGMGMPRQEHWILDNFERIGASVIIPVGGLIEYFTDRARVPPRWMGAIGLEWFFRLVHRPERYWFRYLIEPWLVLAWLVRKALRHWLDLR